MTMETFTRCGRLHEHVARTQTRNPNAVESFTKYGITQHDINKAHRSDEPLIPQQCMLKRATTWRELKGTEVLAGKELTDRTKNVTYLLHADIPITDPWTPKSGRGARLERHAKGRFLPFWSCHHDSKINIQRLTAQSYSYIQAARQNKTKQAIERSDQNK
jgi:hypothetical protein